MGGRWWRYGLGAGARGEGGSGNEEQERWSEGETERGTEK